MLAVRLIAAPTIKKILSAVISRGRRILLGIHFLRGINQTYYETTYDTHSSDILFVDDKFRRRIFGQNFVELESQCRWC